MSQVSADELNNHGDNEHSDEVRRQYAIFCQGVLRSFEQSWNEFLKLQQLPFIHKIALTRDDKEHHVLVLQYEPIFVRDPVSNFLHYIGPMAASFKRVPEVDLTLVNLERLCDLGNKKAYHPHVSESGYFCAGNRELILQELSVGNIPRVAQLVFDSLQVYTASGNPFSQIHNWPLKSEKEYFDAEHNSS